MPEFGRGRRGQRRGDERAMSLAGESLLINCWPPRPWPHWRRSWERSGRVFMPGRVADHLLSGDRPDTAAEIKENSRGDP